MKQMTYDEYDALTETFEHLKEEKKVPVVWPTVQQIDMFYNDPERWLFFCCYLYECNPAPSSQTEKYSKKNLGMFINENLELVDNNEENL